MIDPGRAAAAGPPPGLWRNLVGGTTGAVVMLAVVVTLGLLGHAPLGGTLARLGIGAALVTAGIGGIVYALARRGRMPVCGPSSATALIFAGLLARLLGDAQVQADPAGMLRPVLAVAGLAVALSGLLQLGMALLRLGRLAQFVPVPVLAGFMNGVALLILLAQLPLLLGLGPGGAGLHPAVLLLGLLTAATTWALAQRWPALPALPAPLCGLLAGLGAYALLRVLWPALDTGPVVGPLPQGFVLPDLALQWATPAGSALVMRHAASVLTTALLLALIGALESLLSALALEREIGERPRPDATLVALGLTNAVVGLLGGLPGVLLRARAVATLRAGGSGVVAALAGSASFIGVAVLAAPLVALLPLAVLAGVMLTVAAGLVDNWTRQLWAQWRSGERGADVWQSLATMALVCVLTVWQGFAVGVAAGCLAALLVFLRGMHRSLIRRRYTAQASPSNRMQPPAQAAWLDGARARIEVLELEGALFFGSAERLAGAAARLPPGLRFLVLDLRGVSMIDANGALLLQRLSLDLADGGVQLLLAGVVPGAGHGRRLHAFGCFRSMPRADWFADLDHAVEAAEQRLLADAGLDAPDPQLPLAQSALFAGLDADEAAWLAGRMPARALAPGELLFRQGGPGDGLYVLTRGSITVVAGHVPGQVQQRHVSLAVGMMFGETATLDGGGRSGTALADGPATVHWLGLDTLEAMRRQRPLLVAKLYRNIAVHLSQRLRRASALKPADGG